MNFRRIFWFVVSLGIVQLQAQHKQLVGTIVEEDSTTAMPFVYIISKKSGNGTMSDNNGRFSLIADLKDTLVCSYVGYFKRQVAVRDLAADEKGEVKLVMQSLPVDLAEVRISTFTYKPYEREYMQDIIDRSKMKTIDYSRSPITALYMRFSKEGKQINKLARIFEQLIIEEQVEKKLNPDILARLTGDDTIDFEAFRRYCYYVSDEFIISHDGVDLYTPIMNCYRRWKSEGR